MFVDEWDIDFKAIAIFSFFGSIERAEEIDGIHYHFQVSFARVEIIFVLKNEPQVLEYIRVKRSISIHGLT